MSIWSSIQGEDPPVYEGGEGSHIDPDGWFDVAVSCLGGGYVRILVANRESQADIALDAAGLMELHRRIVIARGQVGK